MYGCVCLCHELFDGRLGLRKAAEEARQAAINAAEKAIADADAKVKEQNTKAQKAQEAMENAEAGGFSHRVLAVLVAVLNSNLIGTQFLLAIFNRVFIVVRFEIEIRRGLNRNSVGV